MAESGKKRRADEPPLVRDLLTPEARALGLQLVAGQAGLDREISHPRIQKASLAVAGYIEAVRPGRVQLLGSAEMTYLRTRGARKRVALVRKICTEAPVCCFVITGGQEVPEELVTEVERNQIALLQTRLGSTDLIERLQPYLDEFLAPRVTIHGVLVDVFGLGVLILGDSGIGKSECALELVTRGHRLVADDVVEIRRESTGVLSGRGPESTRYHMEVRGLGLVNIKDLFGISAIRESKFIELVVCLEAWQRGQPYDRLGIDDVRHSILDLELPLIRMPVAAGRNLAVLFEVAARNELLKRRGYHAARRFVAQHTFELERMEAATPLPESKVSAPKPRVARERE